MQAILIRRFGGPEVMSLSEVPNPVAAAGQVVVATRAIGVNPVDTYIRAGGYGPREFPHLLGFDAAGVIESMGNNVHGWRVGDSVYTFSTLGTYAQKIVVEEKRVFAMPQRTTFAQAACVGVPGATAWRAMFQRGRARPGESILIHGATGGVGTAAVQLAAAAGLRVAGTGGTEGGRKLIRQLGCELVLDHRKPDYMKEGMEFTGGRGFDVIVEMLANVNLERDLQVLAKNGRVVVVGNRGRVEIDPRTAMGKDADIRAMALFNASDAEMGEIHAALHGAMSSGVYAPIVARELPLAEAGTAHREIMENHAPGNIVLIP